CVHTILEIAQKLHERKKRERYDFENLDFSLSIYDNDSVYGSLPKLLLFKNRLSDEQIDKIRGLLFLFVRDFHTELDIHLKHLYYSFKKYVWNADYQFAYNCFIGLLLYAEFNKKHPRDRKSTRLNSSHVKISYAVFCLKKKNKIKTKNYYKT